MNKKSLILFISFVVFFLLFSVHTEASSVYAPVTAKIPFECKKPDSDKEMPYIIVLDTVSANAPKPDVNSLTLKGGQNGNFKITVTEPGTYIYRISQKKGSVEKAIYDEKEYDVYLYVINDDRKELSYTLSVVEKNTDIKPDDVVFANQFEAEQQKEDPPAVDEPSKPDDPSGRMLNLSDMNASKTGENNVLYIGLYLLVLLGLSAGAGAYIASKKRRKKEEV